MNIPKNFYLAHPLYSRKEVRKWELDFEKKTNIKLYNPFYDVYREDIEDLDKNVLNPRKRDSKIIVLEDLEAIKKHEGILCWIDKNLTVGTFQEMVYAHVWGKIVYSIIQNEKLENHPWLEYHSNKRFKNEKEFENFILKNI